MTSPSRVSAGPWQRFARAILPPPGGEIAAGFQRLKRRAWLFILVPLVWAIYAYFASAGGRPSWPAYLAFHDLQADGFRAGRLDIPVSPPPELVAAKDPYDPVNIRYWLLDASLYRDKYYIYWGPVPALMQAAVKSVLGIRRTIGDQYLSFALTCLSLWSGAFLIERMARRLFGRVSRLLVAIGVLVFAFANPTVHAVTTASTYMVSIMGGQAFLLLGLLPAFDAVWCAGADRGRRFRLVLAGTCWALGLATRVTAAPTIAIFVVVTAVFEAARGPKRWRRALSNSVWLGAPLVLVGCLLLVYNKLRFDDFLEFGTNLQLAAFPTFRVSSEYLVPNLYSYLLRPFKTACQFPYVFQVWTMGKDAFPAWVALPSDYMILEPVVGWLRAVPLTWLIPFAFLLAARPFGLESRHNRTYLWCLVTFSALAGVTGLVGMGVYGATMRYMTDVTFGLVLLSLMGAYAIKTHRFANYVPRATSAGVSLLAGASIVIGILLGYHGYNGHIKRYNPELDAKIVKALSMCGSETPVLPRYDPALPQ